MITRATASAAFAACPTPLPHARGRRACVAGRDSIDHAGGGSISSGGGVAAATTTTTASRARRRSTHVGPIMTAAHGDPASAAGSSDMQMHTRLGIRDPWAAAAAAAAAAAGGPAAATSAAPSSATVTAQHATHACGEHVDPNPQAPAPTAPAVDAAADPSAPSLLLSSSAATPTTTTTAATELVLPDGNAKPVKPWDSTTGAQNISYLGRRVAYLRRRTKLLQRSYDECRRITALFSKTFYMGTTLLSPDKRKATWAVYTWCRRTDELVDGPRVLQRSESLTSVLEDWHARLDDIFYRGKARDALDLVLIDVCSTFPDMSITPFREMINGMQMDVEQARFQTWEDLYLYCYRVAGTVGLMTLPIMGTVKPGREGLHEASEPALALGIALQLTNILRDVGEDRLRGRIYLPLEDLDRFNYTQEDLMNCVLDSRYKSLIKFEIARARRYYAKAKRGIPLLAPESRLPVQASLDMYSQILDVIEENGYDNFHRRAYISKRRKISTIPLSYLRVQDDSFSKIIRRGAEWLYGMRPSSR